jgi:hypothetical protein
MNDERRHDHDVHELLVPYALQQLDGSERAAVERALERDPDLRRELDDVQHAGTLLLERLPRQAAPASVRAGVMAAVRGSAQSASTVDVASDSPARPGPARRRARQRWFSGPAFSGALVAACVLFAVVAVNVSRDLDAANVRVERLERAVADARQQPATIPAGFADAEPHSVPTTHEFSSASGSLIRVSDETWLLAFNDVPEPAKGRSWQVWTAHESGEVQNVAQWHTGGKSRLLVLDSDDIVEVMVSYESTTEPAPAPTGEPVADVKV